MAQKADFNAEEWSLLRQGPPLAGLIVMLADRGGTVRESLTMGRFYAETRALWSDTGGAPQGLVEEIIAAGPEIDQARFGGGPSGGVRPDEVQAQGLDAIGDAVATLARHADAAEVEDYRHFILELAQRVAEAHKEGGVLGIGGKRVSDAEQAALDQIRSAVGG